MVVPLELWKVKLEQMHGPGELMHGSDMTDAQAEEWAWERFGVRDHCIVRDWLWYDFSVFDEVAAEARQNGLQPVIIRSNYVVYDSAGRFDRGNWVHTSPLKEFSEDFIFETRNTVYILLGLGYRKVATEESPW